ncbi:MAG: helix-turn-helix transcriptional regulator [Bacteroidales bacterium]|nr:helix-turn-helix transcriptional regulator [Bacteroidales bacterium]
MTDKQKTPETPAELLQLIRDTAKERGISAYRLALETGLVPNTVQRLFRDANDARLSQIMPILKYFGFEVR